MSIEVYANGMSIACKAADGKTIAAFPDVCFTPPLTPATPPGVPIPYPNTAMASDTTDGTKTVKINGQEVMLKNLSVFKTSTGDEAGSAPKKGIVTSTIKGEASFVCWSMDVKFEGENVPRHLDLMGHNEQCSPSDTPPWPYLDKLALECPTHPCVKSGDVENVRANCDGPPEDCYTQKCCDARKCVLVPYSPNKCCSENGTRKTPHHIVLKSQFKEVDSLGGAAIVESYNPNKAPCICEDGESHSFGKHGEIHTFTNNETVNHASVKDFVRSSGKSILPKARWKVSEAEDVGARATAVVTECDKACIEAQVRSGHAQMGVAPDSEIRPTTAGKVTKPLEAGPSTF